MVKKCKVNFSADWIYKHFNDNFDKNFFDEKGQIINSIKVHLEPSLVKDVGCQHPFILFDPTRPEKLTRKIIKLDSNNRDAHLKRFNIQLASRPITGFQRWLPGILRQIMIFQMGQIPKGWREVTFVPNKHFIEVDLANKECRIVGPNVNREKISKWIPFINNYEEGGE